MDGQANIKEKTESLIKKNWENFVTNHCCNNWKFQNFLTKSVLTCPKFSFKRIPVNKQWELLGTRKLIIRLKLVTPFAVINQN